MSNDNNNNGKIGPESLFPQEKDPRWDEMVIALPIIHDAMKWLEKPEVWGGFIPANFESSKEAIEEIIAQAVFDAFVAGLDEVQNLCRALVLCPDEDEFPDKYRAVTKI